MEVGLRGLRGTIRRMVAMGSGGGGIMGALVGVE